MNHFGMTRRSFLADCGMGFTGLALGALLHRDGISRAIAGPAVPSGKPDFTPKAKRVIWLFMVGGTSHMESFDPKPELNKHAGQTIESTPFKKVISDPRTTKNVRQPTPEVRKLYNKILPLQEGFQKYGKNGTEVCNWWPH